mgnify:CR=1 FL=1
MLRNWTHCLSCHSTTNASLGLKTCTCTGLWLSSTWASIKKRYWTSYSMRCALLNQASTNLSTLSIAISSRIIILQKLSLSTISLCAIFYSVITNRLTSSWCVSRRSLLTKIWGSKSISSFKASQLSYVYWKQGLSKILKQLKVFKYRMGCPNWDPRIWYLVSMNQFYNLNSHSSRSMLPCLKPHGRPNASTWKLIMLRKSIKRPLRNSLVTLFPKAKARSLKIAV